MLYKSTGKNAALVSLPLRDAILEYLLYSSLTLLSSLNWKVSFCFVFHIQYWELIQVSIEITSVIQFSSTYLALISTHLCYRLVCLVCSLLPHLTYHFPSVARGIFACVNYLCCCSPLIINEHEFQTANAFKWAVFTKHAHKHFKLIHRHKVAAIVLNSFEISDILFIQNKIFEEKITFLWEVQT